LSNFEEMADAWMAAKAEERAATDTRRLIEDEMCQAFNFSPEDASMRRLESNGYTLKVTGRLSHKVDDKLAQEIAAEHDVQEYLPILFRWKPELNVGVWDGASERIRAIFAPAITTLPQRLSFSVTKKEKA
tara:strand:- start:8 stop:400 length:393 start_codon:yes stop_codon:yes gene_type:complete